MGFWRAGPMHCLGAGLPSSTTGTAGSTNCGLKTAASARKAPGMTGVDSTGASVTTSCLGTRTTRTRPALFSRKVNKPPCDALTRLRAPTPNRARRGVRQVDGRQRVLRRRCQDVDHFAHYRSFVFPRRSFHRSGSSLLPQPPRFYTGNVII